MKLTNTAVTNAKPRQKRYRLFDGKGLYLEVQPSGARYWRLKYRIDGKEKRLSLGTYPDTSLKEARAACDEAKGLLRDGIDPSADRKAQKTAKAGSGSFEFIAREWYSKFSRQWAEAHTKRVIRLFERDLFPYLGDRDMSDITASILLKVLRRIENRGALETAHRARQCCGQVFRYAVSTGRAEHDPTYSLKGALPSRTKKHFATMTDPKEIGQLLRDIDGYSGHLMTCCALRLAPLLFVRPGELRHAEWDEFDFDAREWHIPAGKMKRRRPHIVPLPQQAIPILSELRLLTGSGKYVFPSIRSPQRCMSENTVNAAIRRLGYNKDQITGHGFRHMASTLLNGQGWHSEAIERQLAHVDRNSTRATYNHADYLPERKKMMQAWANYLDSLKGGATVTPIRAGATIRA